MAKGEVKKSKYIFVFLRIAVVVCGIIWAIVWGSREQRWHKLTEINLAIFAGTLSIFVLCQVIIGLRWWLLLRSQSIFIPFFSAVRLHFLGLFYNNCMPGSVGGDLIRAWYVTKHTDKKFEAALSVFVDRIIGLLSTLVIATFFYALFLRSKDSTITFSGSSGFLKSVSEYKWILLSVCLAIAALFCLPLLHSRGRSMLRKIWLNIWLHSIRAIKKLKDAAIIYCSKPTTILGVFGLTIFVQIVTITGFWFLGVNLGITASIKYYYVFFTLTWVLGAVPVSIGGAVVVEGMLMVLFINIADVAKDSAYALALCQRFVWILASLPGAVIHLMGAHLPKDFSVDYDKSIN